VVVTTKEKREQQLKPQERAEKSYWHDNPATQLDQMSASNVWDQFNFLTVTPTQQHVKPDSLSSVAKIHAACSHSPHNTVIRY